jgi:hypothetical protein
LLPAAGFIRRWINALVRVRCPVPVETRFSIRPFALRQRRSALRQTSAAGSTFLACIFETIPKFSSTRSVASSRPRLAFYGLSEVRSMLATRCRFPFRNSASVVRPPLPVGISQSLRLVAPSLISNVEACLCESPDFPSLPAAGFIRRWINALVRVRCPVPVETRFSIRPFALRQRRFTFRQISAAGSTFLACIFETIPKFLLARSVPDSRPRLAFYGRSGRDQCPQPVAKFDFGTQRLYSDFRSPSGFLNPFGS